MVSSDFYQHKINQFQGEVDKTKITIRQYSYGRLGIALIILSLGYLGLSNSVIFYPIPILMVLFIFFVRKQVKVEEQQKLLLNLVKLNQLEANSINFIFDQFPDGTRFIDPHHSFSNDLDLFGKGSLFQYINRCATRLGENKLAKDLTGLNFNTEAIIQRQEAIRELGPLSDLRQNSWATGKQIQDSEFDLKILWSWLKEPSLFYGKRSYTIIRWVLPIITCLCLFGVLFNSVFQSIFFFMMIVQLVLCGVHSKQIVQFQLSVSVYKTILGNYSKIFQLLKEQPCSSAIMKKHCQLANEAADSVAEFSSLANALESRMNVMAMMFGNGLFLYDLHAVARLEKWRSDHAQSLPNWLDSLAEWDALLSFATLHFNQPSFVFGEINETLSIKGKEIGHPLIPSPQRITNNFELGNPSTLMLVTGANMAGKSTFLRAIGVNYVLAKNGSPVCATAWSSPVASLRTGMRTSDSLQEHQSYFFAELNRLQSIIEELRSGNPMILLLDEILKGTNSTDKQAGSRELIKQLIQQKALVLLATHDIALADMEQQYSNQICNTCFEGKIENDQLTFDYKLNRGVAQRANATFLMRKMGIIPAID